MFSEADRNTAPPAESAVWKRRRREHSGADRLNGAFAECGREVGRYVMRVKHKREEPMAGFVRSGRADGYVSAAVSERGRLKAGGTADK